MTGGADVSEGVGWKGSDGNAYHTVTTVLMYPNTCFLVTNTISGKDRHKIAWNKLNL